MSQSRTKLFNGSERQRKFLTRGLPILVIVLFLLIFLIVQIASPETDAPEISSTPSDPIATELEQPQEPEEEPIPDRLATAAELTASTQSFSGLAQELWKEQEKVAPSGDHENLVASLTQAIDGGVGVTHLSIVDANTLEEILTYQDDPTSPLSLIKTVTAMYVLETLGPDHRFTTSVFLNQNEDTWTLTIKGTGDSLITDKKIQELATKTVESLESDRSVEPGDVLSVAIDDSAFTGPSLYPNWSPELVTSGNIVPIRPATMYGGREQSGTGADRAGRDPNDVIGERFYNALGQEIQKSDLELLLSPLVSGAQLRREVSEKAEIIAEIESDKISTQVKHALEHSDNQVTENLIRGALVAQDREASNESVVNELTEYLRGFVPKKDGESLSLLDGSGLNPYSAVSVSTLNHALLTVLRANDESNPRQEEAAAILNGLAIAGKSGTLKDRYFGAEGALQIRGKTGTLLHAMGLSAIADTSDNRYVITIVIDNSLGQTSEARNKIDRIVSQLSP